MFLKAKTVDGENLLVAIGQISTVTATNEGTLFKMKNGNSYFTTLGFQAVGNRLADLDIQVV